MTLAGILNAGMKVMQKLEKLKVNLKNSKGL